MPNREEHHDDMVCRLEVQRLITNRKIKGFLKTHPARIKQLLTTYNSDDAQFLLDELREMFWENL